MELRKRPTLMAIRLFVVFGFLVVMPLIAIPSVNRSIGALFRPADEPDPRSEAVFEEELRPVVENVVAELTPPAAPLEKQSSRVPPVMARQPPEKRIEEIQERLKHLGASYFMLERLGEQGEKYHFRCVLPVAENGVYDRVFDATTANPLEAMEAVLDQVEGWCLSAGRGPAATAADRH